MREKKAVEKVLILTLILNLAVAISKIILGLMTGALAITADGFHSLTDSAGNVAGLLALRVANKPADENHPYGHHRFETLAALLIGALLLLTAWELSKALIEKWQNPSLAEINLLSFAVMFLTLIINIIVSRYQIHEGKRLKSEILLADAENTSADVFVTLSVLLSIFLIQITGWLWLDSLAAFFVLVLIAKAAWKILERTVNVLVDTAPYEPQELIAIVSDLAEVNRARSRGSKDAAHIDMDLRVPAEMSIGTGEALACTVRQRLEAELGGISEIEVHFVPE